MSDIALHLDSTRARAACLGPSGVMVPVLDPMGQVAMPMVVAEGHRGELVSGRQAAMLALDHPSRWSGHFLPNIGAARFGRHGADTARLLELSLEPMKRIRKRDSIVSMTAPAYLDDSLLTVTARAVESAGWKVRVASSSALALWCAAREQAAAPSGIVCECDEHAMSLSLVAENGDRVSVHAVRVLRNLSLSAWRKCIVSGLADATVRSIRRDPRADSRLDGTLARHAASWLDEEAPPARPTALELNGNGWNAKLTITPGQVIDWCAPLLRLLGKAISELQAVAGATGPAKALILASTARLPGVSRLAESLHENWLGPLHPDAQLEAQAGWLGAVNRGEADPGLWRSAPVSPPAVALACQGAP